MIKSFARGVAATVFATYFVFLLSITVNWWRILRFSFSVGSTYNWQPLQGIIDILKSDNPAYIFANIAGNVFLFVPLGFFLPLLWRRWRFVPTLLAGTIFSAIIESVQFVTGRGADIDDVLLNTLGTLIGFLVFSVFRAITPRMALALRFDRQKRSGKEWRKRWRWLPVTTALMICVLLSGQVLLSKLRENPGRTTVDALTRPARNESPTTITPDISVGSAPLYSKTAYLLSLRDDRVLLDLNSYKRIYPASMTKIMTVLVAIEQLPALDAVIELRADIFEKTTSENAATAGFLPGEHVKAIDLLFGAMLPSGAECSIGLAEYIAGSEDAFVMMMNRKAEQLGLEDTQFANATGLHTRGHYTTARDMVLLLQSALDNDLFAAIFTTSRHSTAPTNLHPDGITMISTLFNKMSRDEIPGVSLLGGKTGYTHEAGQCLVSLAEAGGNGYILITAGAYPEDPLTQLFHIEDARGIYSSFLPFSNASGYDMIAITEALEVD